MKNPFDQASYLAQVRRLKKMAILAIAKFPIAVDSIHFINHWENATFRIVAKNRRQYLLRIHRNGYHSSNGIETELRWLTHLSNLDSIRVPKPVRSKRHRLVEWTSTEDLPKGRYCSVLEWIDGTFINKSLSPAHMHALGQLIATIQANPLKTGAPHRHYWDTEGLVGKSPKFGSIESLSGIPRTSQKIINETRALVFARLRAFEKKYPQRQGMIHADFHFGNVLVLKNGLAAIDFDDCGFGFFAYDLVMPIISVQYMLGKTRRKEFEQFKEALINGYRSRASWDSADEAILRHLISARRLTMLGWLQSRSEHPKLKAQLKPAVRRAIVHFKQEYDGSS